MQRRSVPGDDVAPAAAIPPLAIDALLTRLEHGLDPHALMIVQGDDVVFKAAWAPYRLDRPALVYSESKTFTSLAIGFLEAEGALALDDSVGAILGRPNPHGITVRHLLTMNTGHSPEQIDRDLRFDVTALLAVPPAAEPGTRFAYNSDATFALSCIVTALTGQRLTDYLRPRLLDPLGIPDRWMKPLAGIEQGFSGFHLTVADIAALGGLLARDGRRGDVQLLPKGYVHDLSQAWSDTADPTRPAPASGVDDWALGYGYQVWRSRHGFRIDGAYGQFGLILPEQGLVISYQGATTETAQTLDAFWNFVEGLSAPTSSSSGDDAADTALARRAAALESWGARDRIFEAVDGAVDTTGWTLHADGEHGWRLSLPDAGIPTGDIAVGRDDWAATTLIASAPASAPAPPVPVAGPLVTEGTALAVAARGERRADGSVAVHIVNTTSPHRMLLERSAEGVVTAAWHTVPLHGRAWDAVLVPPALAR